MSAHGAENNSIIEQTSMMIIALFHHSINRGVNGAEVEELIVYN
jgi:hypothetical protein